MTARPTPGRRVGFVLAAALLVAGVASSSCLPAREAAAKAAHRSGTTHRVTIEQLRFEPEVLTVHRGDRVIWVNKDPIPHTATARPKARATAHAKETVTAHEKAGAKATATTASTAFDSGSIPAGGSWSYRATVAGEYEYGCNFHPTMKGKLIVR